MPDEPKMPPLPDRRSLWAIILEWPLRLFQKKAAPCSCKAFTKLATPAHQGMAVSDDAGHMTLLSLRLPAGRYIFYATAMFVNEVPTESWISVSLGGIGPDVSLAPKSSTVVTLHDAGELRAEGDVQLSAQVTNGGVAGTVFAYWLRITALKVDELTIQPAP